jgi:hypothetical protein
MRWWAMDVRVPSLLFALLLGRIFRSFLIVA